MSERPIVFSAPMIRALIAGRKTQTRRVLTPGTCTVLGNRVTAKSPAWTGLKFDRAWSRTHSPASGGPRPHLAAPWVHPEDEARGMEADAIYRVDPAIEVGDRLWVKEACGRRTASFLGIEAKNGVEEAFYRADDEDVLNEHEFNLCPWWEGKTISPIFMPRWASRLTLVVTDVRVQRLRDISDEDAIAEGCKVVRDHCHVFEGSGYDRIGLCHTSPAMAFSCRWDEIHGSGSWAANPWVAAITFDVIQANIDAAPPSPTRSTILTGGASHG